MPQAPLPADVCIPWDTLVRSHSHDTTDHVATALRRTRALVANALDVWPTLYVCDNAGTVFTLAIVYDVGTLRPTTYVLGDHTGTFQLARVRCHTFGVRVQAALTRAMARWHDGFAQCAVCGRAINVRQTAERYCQHCTNPTEG